MDFIEYKTKLLLEEAQGDPIKLSRLAGNIIQSISVIPDDITRSLYLRQASQKLGIQEKLMSDGVVRQIRKNQEEEHKRHAISAADLEYAESNGESADTTITASKKTEFLPQEKDIAALLVKYGGRICCEAEDENKQPVSLTVAEYISINLAQDNIVLENPLYRQILEETLTGILEQPGFNAESYFINHENQQIASLAFHLSQDSEQLSKIYGEQAGMPSDKELEDSTTHALASLKLAIITRQLTTLTREMNMPGISPEKSRQLLLQFKTLQEIKKMLSKTCGQRVLG